MKEPGKSAFETAGKVTDLARLTLTRHVRQDAENEKVVIFVHRLSRDPGQSWGKLPQMILEDDQLSFFDLAQYDYSDRTSPLRLPFFRGIGLPSLSELGNDLAESLLTDLIAGVQYKQVSVLAHGLGGLISMEAVRNLVQVYGAVGASRIHSMIFYGAPYLRTESRLLSFFSPEERTFARKPKERWSLSNFWTRSVSGMKEESGRYWIPQAWFISSSSRLVRQSDVMRPGETHTVDKNDEDLLKMKDERDPVFQQTKSFLLKSENYQEERLKSLTGETWPQLAPYYDRLAESIADENTFIIQVVGPEGSGKTSLVQTLIRELDRSRFRVVEIAHPSVHNFESLKQHAGRSRTGEGDLETVLVIDHADEIAEDSHMFELLKGLAKSRSFEKIILASRKMLPLVDEAGDLRQAVLHLSRVRR